MWRKKPSKLEASEDTPSQLDSSNPALGASDTDTTLVAEVEGVSREQEKEGECISSQSLLS